MAKELTKSEWLQGLIMLVPMGAIFFGLRNALIRLQTPYILSEGINPSAEECQLPIDPDEYGAIETPLTNRIRPTEIEENIRSGKLLKHFSWKKLPLIERLAVRTFTVREKVLAEALLARNLNWTSLWRKSAIIISLLLLATLFQRWLNPYLIYISLFIFGFSAAIAVLPIINLLGRCFIPFFLSGINIPLYAGFPIGYSEISKITLKIALVRWLAALPLILILGFIVS